MASGTVIPVPKMQFFDNNGAALAGGKLYCYAAGTTTHQAVYSNAALTSAIAQPVTLDSSGRAAIFLQAKAYKFLLHTSSDVELWAIDDVFALQPSEAINLELTGTAGEDLVANNGVYLSDGSGSKTAGRWYKADADNTYSSTDPKVGLAVAAIDTGETGLIRIGGTMDGFSSLTLGAKEYVSGTAGALTETAPTNAKVMGWAMSATQVVIDPAVPNVGVMELLHCDTGSTSTESAHNFDTYAFVSGALDAKDSLIIKWALTVTGATLVDPILWSETDSAQIGNLSENNIPVSSNGGLASMSIVSAELTKVIAAPDGSNALGSLHTVSTNWTAAWTLAMRGENGSGGTTKWQWAVYALRGV